MKKMTLALCALLSMSSVFASKDGGNGQLVIKPMNGGGLVPYEVAKTLDSAVYQDFYKLPFVNGNVERRTTFNRPYALYSINWLKTISEYTPVLHAELINAAKNTTFRISNSYIYWQHEPYPQGEMDMKTYEKAAFYNGEIILSTLVMDKIVDVEGMTKEESQGFVIVHELINAAFPDMPIKQKLALGEALANIKILGWTKEQFIGALIENKLIHLAMSQNNVDESFNSVMSGLHSLGEDYVNNRLRLLPSVGYDSNAYTFSFKGIEDLWDIYFASGMERAGALKVFESLQGSHYDRALIMKGFLDTLCVLKVSCADYGVVFDESFLEILDKDPHFNWQSFAYLSDSYRPVDQKLLKHFFTKKRRAALIVSLKEFQSKLQSGYYEQSLETFIELIDVKLGMDAKIYKYRSLEEATKNPWVKQILKNQEAVNTFEKYLSFNDSDYNQTAPSKLNDDLIYVRPNEADLYVEVISTLTKASWKLFGSYYNRFMNNDYGDDFWRLFNEVKTNIRFFGSCPVETNVEYQIYNRRESYSSGNTYVFIKKPGVFGKKVEVKFASFGPKCYLAIR